MPSSIAQSTMVRRRKCSLYMALRLQFKKNFDFFLRLLDASITTNGNSLAHTILYIGSHIIVLRYIYYLAMMFSVYFLDILLGYQQ